MTSGYLNKIGLRYYRLQLGIFFLTLFIISNVSIANSVVVNHSKNVIPEQASTLKTALVTTKIMHREFRLDGNVEAINKATVSAQTRGTVKEILVDVDDFVEQGSPIIRLNDVSQQAQFKKAKAGEKEALSHLTRARAEYSRIKDVYVKKVVAKSAMDEATHGLTSAKARLESAKASLESAKVQLSYTLIQAPYSGIVTKRHVQLGEIVQPGSKVMTGVSLDKLRVNIDVPQSLINKIRQYKKAYVYTQSQNKQTTKTPAEKITIFPIADQATNTFKVRLDLPEGIKGLFPGMFIKTAFVTGEQNVLTVPLSSIVYRSEVNAVYVVTEKGEIKFRHVRLGEISDDQQMILSGLSANEKVAIDPILAGVKLMQQRQKQLVGSNDD